MSTRAQWVLVAGAIALAALGLFAATRVLSGELTLVGAGSVAPDFSARTLDEPPAIRTLADYRGDVVLLNVWATWCPPCRVEMPSMEALHREFAPRGLRVVAVSIDEPGSEDGIREFVKDYGLTFEVLHDPAKRIQAAYQTSGVPETLLIGRDGVIRRKVLGASDWSSESSRAVVAQLVAEAAP